MCVWSVKPARPRPCRRATDLLNGGVVSRSDRVRSDATIRGRQVHCEASGCDHALAVVSWSCISVTEGRGRSRLRFPVRRGGSLLIAIADEVLSVVRLVGEGRRLARVLLAVGGGTRGARRREHLGRVHGGVRQQRAGRGGPGRHRGRRRRFTGLTDRHLRTHAPVTRVLPRQLSTSQRRRVHAASSTVHSFTYTK